MFSVVMDRFVEQSPTSVMFRGTLENAVTPQLLDETFARTAKRQVCGELLFSSVVDLLALVTTGARKSVNHAYRARKEQFTVSVTSVYNKLNGVETEVSRQMVRQTAERLAEVVRSLSPRHAPLVRGYRTKIIDGNHLAATEHRIEELRTIGSGPLPGLALVILEPDRMLVSDVFPCEDGHAQERRILPQVLPTVAANDLWIADRNFCTTGFLFGIANRGAAFVIRQHKQTLHYELLGERRKIGRCPTGMLYEQKMRLIDQKGKTKEVRRVTIELKTPTRNGETEINLLTNLPAKVANARSVADLYLHHGGGAWRRGEAPDDFWLLSGGGTRCCVSRDDDCRSARGMDTPFRIVDACPVGCDPQNIGGQGPSGPFPQEHTRSQEAASQAK